MGDLIIPPIIKKEDIAEGVDEALNRAMPTPVTGSAYEILKRLLDNMTLTRITNLDRLDVAVSTRSSHAPLAVWDILLADILATDSIGLLLKTNVDVAISTRSAPGDILVDPAVKIDAGRLNRMPAFDEPIEGTLSPAVLGTEYDVAKSEVGVSHYLEGWIDVSEMAAGDEVVITYYVSLVTPVAYKKYASETLSGVQDNPAFHLVTRPARYGIKVTLNQTAGTLRSFPFQFFRRRIV